MKQRNPNSPAPTAAMHKAIRVACALLFTPLFTPLAHAAITVSLITGSAPNDTLLVASDGADSIAISCIAGRFAVNGAAAAGGAFACNAAPNLLVQGGPLSNLIDLSAITEADFGAGLRINALGGAGADSLLGSPLADVLSGGTGDDVMVGGAGNDVMRWLPGDGSDTLDGQGGVDRMDFIGSVAAESFRLAPIPIAFPGSQFTLRFTRDVGNITMNMTSTEEIFVDGVSGVDQALIDDVSAEVSRVKLNFGAGATPNGITVSGTSGVNNFSLNEAVPGTVAIVGASAPIELTGLKPGDAITLLGLDGPDQFLAPQDLSERLSLSFFGGNGLDGAAVFGDARDERYRFVDGAAVLTLTRVAPTGRSIDFNSVEALELDTGGGVDELNTQPLANTALVLAGGAPSGPRDDILSVQNFAGATDLSPITQAGTQPIIFSGFERTNEYVVHNLSDSDFSSLRDRVSDAVRRPGRLVIFETGLAGSVLLNSPIALGGSVNIVGPGANVLDVRPATFNGSLLINPSNSNAFIFGLGFIGLPNAANTSVAITNQGTLTLSNVNVNNHPIVAIRNSGELTVRNAALTSNTSVVGFAPVENAGTLRFVNTTIAENRAFSGVIRNDAGGQLSLINTTFAKNTTFFLNGSAGLINSGNTVAINSIISENAGTQPVSGNALNAQSSNNLIGTNAIVLGDLANNGSASTLTLAILAGSAAHNTGSNAAVSTANFGPGPFQDQRGAPFVRISDSTVDIGAFELQPLPEVLFASGFE